MKKWLWRRVWLVASWGAEVAYRVGAIAYRRMR